MSKYFTTGIAAVLCLVLAGCGSDGPNLRPELEKLTEQVEKQTEQLGELETDLDTERKEATAREEELQEQVDEAKEEAAETQEQLEEAQQAAVEAEQRAQQARQQAQEEVRRQAQALEANQRAERLLTVLQGIVTTDPAQPLSAPSALSSRVAISVPSRNSLIFKSAGYTPRTISAPGLRGARLTQSRGGMQTTVVYTDIELSRSLIKTYDLDAANDAETIPATDITDLGDGNFLTDTDAFVITGHGFPSSTTEGTTIDPKTGTSFSGSLNGVGGKFECTGADCMTLTPTYANNRLTGVGVTGVATFKPTSRTATVSLCEAPRSQCAPTDADYMAFGWWRSESTGGSYQFESFAFGPSLATTAPTAAMNASFDGTAVGMYVEQNQIGTAVTKRQGEFVAAARLDHDGTNLTGTIDGFNTTPTGDSGAPSTTGWVVKLNTAGATEFERQGPDGSGTWTHAYTADGSAVVGIFESELEEVLHIVGAFGAQQ